MAKRLKNDILMSFKDIKDSRIKHAKEGLFIRIRNIYEENIQPTFMHITTAVHREGKERLNAEAGHSRLVGAG